MKVMVAMSGGVDSAVTAALVRDMGHEVVGVTMRQGAVFRCAGENFKS